MKKDIRSVFVSRTDKNSVCLCISIFSIRESALGKIVDVTQGSGFWNLLHTLRFLNVVQVQFPNCSSVFWLFCAWRGRDGKERADRNLQLKMRFQRDFLFQCVCLGNLEFTAPGNTSGRMLILMIDSLSRLRENLWRFFFTKTQGWDAVSSDKPQLSPIGADFLNCLWAIFLMGFHFSPCTGSGVVSPTSLWQQCKTGARPCSKCPCPGPQWGCAVATSCLRITHLHGQMCAVRLYRGIRLPLLACGVLLPAGLCC